MSIYLDASVLLPTIIPEPGSMAVDQFLDSAHSEFHVSEFAAAEVSSAISRLVRMGLVNEPTANLRLAAFDAWRLDSAESIEVAGADVRLADVIVRRFDLKLRAPDALHVAICRRLDLTLVTMDRRLAGAGEAFGVVVTLI